jgi:predicted RNA-binding Zn ribbon-like protein
MVSDPQTISPALGFVLDLLNTVDLRTYGDSRALLERDQLADGAGAGRWLAQQGITGASIGVADHSADLREIREQLRAALAGQGSLRLEGLIGLTIQGGASPRLVPRRHGDPVEAVAALIVSAATTPGWLRLRMCAAEDCRRAFYDHSRNGRSRWCSMRTCGNRMKTRSYRERARGSAASHVSLTPSPGARRARTHTFRREGDYWTIGSSGRRFRLKDSKGLRYLARLLAEPHREFHVMDLARGGAPAEGTPREAKASYPLLDSEARRSYEARLIALRAEIEEAESWGDDARASRAHDELQFVADELQRSTGVAGRDRSFATDSERARVSVTRVIKAALTRIADESPELKHHFASTVRTGTYCSYSPDPRLPAQWEL